MAQPDPPATVPVTPTRRQTFVSSNNTAVVYKSSSQVDGQDERLHKPKLTRDRLKKFLDKEMFCSIADHTDGLLELAFPESALPISVDDAVNLLVEKNVLTKDPKLEWTTDITALTTYNRPDGTCPEDYLGDFLNNIGTVLLKSGSDYESRRWSTAATAAALDGGPAERKPDVVLTSEATEESVTWKNIYSTVQLKYADDSRHRRENAEQLSSDAFMAFSTQNTRRFFLGVSICAHTVRIYAFNRAGRVSSVPFGIHEDPRSFVHLLIGLMLCPTNLIGLDASYVWRGSYFSLRVGGVFYRLLECAFRRKSIRGRGTTCWRAVRDDDPDGPEYAIKDTWTDTSRTPEAKLMEILDGVEGIPKLIGSEELAHADGRDVTSYFRKNVKTNKTQSKSKKQKKNVEFRRHSVIVTFPFAQPLASFSSKKELLSALVDTIRAHRGMLTRNVLHRDISLDNLMIYKPTKLQKNSDVGTPEDLPVPVSKKGLLIDIDYSVVLTMGTDKRQTAIGHRTGTLPFMAIEILEGDTSHHASHHDLESFFYVLVWLCIFYRGPNNSLRFRSLDEETALWTGTVDISMTNLALIKRGLFGNPHTFEQYITKNSATYFRDLIPCLKELRPLYFNDAPPVAHDTMTNILQRHIDTFPDVDDWVDDEMPKISKKRGRDAHAECPPVKRMRTRGISQQTCILPPQMTRLQVGQSASSRGGIDESSAEEHDNEEEDEDEEEDSSDGESDDEERDPTYHGK